MKYKLGMTLYRSVISTFTSLGGWQFMKRKYRNDMYGRDGNVQDIPEGCIWVHAVSVGEVQSASSLIRQIKRTSTYPCIISTVTTTGRDMAMRLLDGVADQIIHSPFDTKKFVSRSLDNINPSIYITMETELWPEMLSQLKSRNIPAFLANGRISEKSFKRMRHTKSFWSGVLECLNKLMVRFDNDKEKFMTLGVPEDKIIVTGDCKVDALLERRKNTSPSKWNWLKKNNAPLFVAGSTHQGEDDVVISAFRILLRKYPEATLAIVPRHPERSLMTIASALPYSDIHAELLSQIDREKYNHESNVIVIDRVGILFDLYAAADSVFVGGSLVEKGGQNPFEPALFGLPAIHGPCMTDFPDTSRMDSMGAAICVNNDSELAHAWEESLSPTRITKALRDCDAYFRTLGGAAKRTWQEIDSYMLDRKEGRA